MLHGPLQALKGAEVGASKQRAASVFHAFAPFSPLSIIHGPQQALKGMEVEASKQCAASAFYFFTFLLFYLYWSLFST